MSEAGVISGSPPAGALLLRRLVPTVAATLLAVGILTQIGEDAGLYGPHWATVLLVVAGIAATSAAIGWNVRTLKRIDTERRRAEAAALEPQERFAQFMRHLPGLAFIKDSEGRYIYVNGMFETVFRLNPQDWPGRTDAELFPADTAAQFVANDRAVMESGRVLQTIEVARHEDGPHHSIVSKFPIPGPDGRPALLGGMAVDITERRRAEETLHRSEQHLQVAIEAAALGSWRMDLAAGFIEASARCKSHFGLRPDAPVDYGTFLAAVHPEDRERVTQALRAAWDSDKVYEAEYRVHWPDGSLHWVTASGRCVRSDGDRRMEMVGVTRDITDRKRSELALRRQGDLVKLLQEVAVAANQMPTVKEAMQAAIDQICRHTGWPVGHAYVPAPDGQVLVSLGTWHLTDPERFRTFRNITDSFRFRPGHGLPGRVWAGGKPLWISDVTEDSNFPRAAQAADIGVRGGFAFPVLVGTEVAAVLEFFSVEAVPPDDELLQTMAHVGEQLGRVVERTRAESDLREADRRKDRFLAVLAHELRNPLAPIRTGLELLKPSADPGAAEEARAVIARQVDLMVRLIDDLLDVSRITSGKLRLRKERVELATICRNAAEHVRPAMAAAGLEFTASLPTQPMYLDADPVRLTQVVVNLLNNAAKYTERGGRISLAAERTGNTAEIRVRDNGIGIPAGMLGRLFEMFVQVEQSMERSQGGLGVGLSLVRSLTEMHGGTVEARSDGPGKGSEFVVRLPLPADALQNGPPPPVARPQAAPAKRRILVADDNVDSAAMLRLALRNLGGEIRTVHDGLAAVEAAESFRPDVALLDIGMPKLNGHDAARRIRQQSWGREMTLIALTGWGQDEDKRRSREAGFDHHLTKPVDFGELTRLLSDGASVALTGVSSPPRRVPPG